MILKIKRYNSNKGLRVGDFVRILPKYLPGTNGSDYRCNFTGDMLENYGGKILKIADKRVSETTSHSLLEDDGFDYELDEDWGFTWTSRMFNKIIV